jgi:hypothetical protein
VLALQLLAICRWMLPRLKDYGPCSVCSSMHPGAQGLHLGCGKGSQTLMLEIQP